MATKYAFFDFDGTLIAKDSFQTLQKYTLRTEPWRVFLLPLALCVYLYLTPFFGFDKSPLKSSLLWAMTFGKTKRQCVQFLKTVAQQDVARLFFSEVSATFAKLKQQNVRLIVISASGPLWIRAALAQEGLRPHTIIGTRLGFFLGGVIFTSKNCYKHEKLRRIRHTLGSDFIWHSSWTDHPADIPLLQQAPHQARHLICPKSKHMASFLSALGPDLYVLYWKTQTHS